MEKRNLNGNGLLLYQFYTSYYSQKVVFALYEKKLNFKTRVVNLGKAEQYQPWYLSLNPKAEVPVLKDGVKVIPDSSRIIDYLEDNFTNGDAARLLPEKGTEQWQKVKDFREKLDNTSVPILTFGSIFHPHLTIDSQIGLLEKIARKKFPKYIPAMLEKLCLKNPEYKELYEEKKQQKQDFFSKVEQEENVVACLDRLETVLDSMEQELASHGENSSIWWLVNESFTIADISLTVLLMRLKHIGFYERFFSGERRPCLQNYYQRVQERESYRKLISQMNTKCHCIQLKYIAIGSTMAVVSLGLIIAFVMFRRKW